MIDKQKQIEEMKKTLDRCCEDESPDKCTFGRNCYYCFAEFLYNAGYRKIPKGAVVLTRKEHIQMLKELANSNEIAYLSGYGKGIKETAEKFAREFINDVLPKIMNGHNEKALQIAMTMTNYCKEITEVNVTEGNVNE